MARTEPDFLLHLGDRIYADHPMNESVILGQDRRWTNIVTPAKQRVAQTVGQYRGNYSYNFIDDHYRRFSAGVPMIATWDDHEVTNNWWPGRKLAQRVMQRKGYTVSPVDLLARRGRQAFFDFTPMRRRADDPDRIYRKVSYGSLLDLFVLDARSYRSANGGNRQAAWGPDASLLGPAQREWLKASLATSRAVWKIVGNPLPIAHVRKTDRSRYDKWANDDPGQPLGRELEIADILSFIKRQRIANVVWLAADVHYSAAHRFDPAGAAFGDFDPFWEFVAGPFHTRPGRVRQMDPTFGPERLFRTPLGPAPDPPPSAGYLYFGHARIDARTAAMTVSLRDLSGRPLYEQTLAPAR
jgi:alkaline phosphatase D